MRLVRRVMFAVLCVMTLVAGLGCRQEAVTDAPTPTVVISAETPPAPTSATPRTLTIIYTNDEHGWMEGVEPGRGAAEIVTRWRDVGCEPDACLIISGGDMWTGPAISTWFDGESMAEVMNAMGYAAAAVGNHEFDFGLEQLNTLAGLSEFPFVSANIRRLTDGMVPSDVGIEPFALVERAGVTIGVVGLSTQRTPQTTLATHVESFEFIDYVAALEEVVPQAQAAGAELIVVAGHLCSFELMQALRAEVQIDVIGGGHCNELSAQVVRNNTAYLIGGSALQSFASAEITLSPTNEVTDVTVATHDNVEGDSDPDVAELIAKWQAATDEELNEVIGYLGARMERRSQQMQDMIAYSWLWAMPSADIAVTNLGGMRAAFPAGDLTLADIIAVLPFDNVIVEVEMTGAQFVRVFGLRPDMAVAGAERVGAGWQLTASGERIDPAATYIVLVSDFMYAGGDELGGIAAADPDGYNTAVDWRQPLIDWAQSIDSSPEMPLDDQIEDLK